MSVDRPFFEVVCIIALFMWFVKGFLNKNYEKIQSLEFSCKPEESLAQ
jgi:hypothetical protein